MDDQTGDGEPLVLYLGARVPHKRLDLLRRAAALAAESRPNARFAFAGAGAPLEDLRPWEIDFGLVSDAERAQLLRRARLLCLPSDSESFGLVVAEAWSVGTPVVTSDIPVLRELVERSGGGVAVSRDVEPLARALEELIDDRGLAIRLGNAGNDFWRRELSPSAVAERHLRIYESAARGVAET
jgi:glycosyltransferase involved in cell wall biosynthesis